MKLCSNDFAFYTYIIFLQYTHHFYQLGLSHQFFQIFDFLVTRLFFNSYYLVFYKVLSVSLLKFLSITTLAFVFLSISHHFFIVHASTRLILIALWRTWVYKFITFPTIFFIFSASNFLKYCLFVLFAFIHAHFLDDDLLIYFF